MPCSLFLTPCSFPIAIRLSQKQVLFFVRRLLYIGETVLIATSANWWAGRKNRTVRILGCVEPERNPLPALGGVRVQGICAVGPEQSGEAIFFCARPFFLTCIEPGRNVTFFWANKKK